MTEPILVMTRREFLALSALASARAAGPAWVRRALGAAPLGVAVLGLGERGCAWVETLARPRPGTRLLAIADPQARALHRGLRRAAGVGSVPLAAHDDTEALADPDVAVVVIAAGGARAARIACAACEAGKDVFLEGPLAPEPDALAELVRTADATGRMVQHATGALSNPRVQRVLEDAAHGRLGTVGRVELRVRTSGDTLPDEAAARAAAWLPVWSVHEIAVALRGLGARGAANLLAAEGVEVDPRSGALAQAVYLLLRFDNERELCLRLVLTPSDGRERAFPVAETTLVLHGTGGSVRLDSVAGERPEQRIAAADRLATWENLLDGMRSDDASRLHAPIRDVARAYDVLHAARAGLMSYLRQSGPTAVNVFSPPGKELTLKIDPVARPRFRTQKHESEIG